MKKSLVSEYLKLHLENEHKLTERAVKDFLTIKGESCIAQDTWAFIMAVKQLKSSIKKQMVATDPESIDTENESVLIRLCEYINANYPKANITPSELARDYILSTSEDDKKLNFYHYDKVINYEVNIVAGLFQRNQRYELLGLLDRKSVV